jgi:hypothetical protein
MKGPVRASEPAVDPEPAVEPAFSPAERESLKFRVTPKEHQQWLETVIPPLTSPLVRRFDAVVNCTDNAGGGGFATVETAYTVRVKELRYPGRPQDSADAAGKWVYVFRQGTLVAEANCIQGDVWEGWAVLGAARRPWRSTRGVQIDPGPRGERYAHSYLLSPVRLPQQIIDEIDPKRLEAEAVECQCSHYEKAVSVPDPLAWACEVNSAFYTPRLHTLSAWLHDPDLLAYDFIARVLKAWIDSGDALGIEGQLERQPGSWLDARAKGIENAYRAAEEAGAYLAHCIWSQEYVAVEKACLLEEGEALELAAVCLAAATEGISQTNPGRQLARFLTLDKNRLPAKIIFQDQRPPLADEWFARYRYGQRGLLGVFSELVGAATDLLKAEVAASERASTKKIAELDPFGGKKMSPQVREGLTRKFRVQKYLENLGVKTTRKGNPRKLSQKQVRILDNLQRGKPITSPRAKGAGTVQALEKEWSKLTLLDEVAKPTAADIEMARLGKRVASGKELVAKAEKLAGRYQPYEKYAKRLKATIGSVVEIVNIVIAIGELKNELEKAGGTVDSKRIWSVVGAFADLVEHGAGLSELLEVESKFATKLIKGVGGVAGAVGGVIDMLDYESQVFEAVDDYDYGKAVGRGMQMAGAASAAAGSAMVAVSLIVEGAGLGSSLGPAGTLVGIFGGTLVAGGFLVAKWLSRNANQRFAVRSFLGNQAKNDPKAVEWSASWLPNRNPKEEAAVLVDLLAQFQLSGSLDELEVRPGYFEENSTFEVLVECRWDNEAARARIAAAPGLGEPGVHGPALTLPLPETYTFEVDLEDGEVRQTSGPPLEAAIADQGADGQPERIRISLVELGARSTGEVHGQGTPIPDEIAGFRPASPSESREPEALRSPEYQVVTAMVRLKRPVKDAVPFRYVPRLEATAKAVQVVLPSVRPVSSLDTSAWVDMPNMPGKGR